MYNLVFFYFLNHSTTSATNLSLQLKRNATLQLQNEISVPSESAT